MKREMRIVECPACGKKFETKNREQKYCSFSCARTKGNGKKPEMVSKLCPNCGKLFFVKKSDHRVKNNSIMYCSKRCASDARKVGIFASCPVCGKMFYTTRHTFCSRECALIYKKNNYVHKSYFENGYIVEYVNGFNKKGNVKQHRKIMEEHLGRKLESDEVVHHINGDKTDNRIENLQLMKRGEHASYHRKEEKKNGKHLFGGYHNN